MRRPPPTRGVVASWTGLVLVALVGCSSPGAPPDPDGGPCIVGLRSCKDLETVQICRPGSVLEDVACNSGEACFQGICSRVICEPGPTGQCAGTEAYERCNQAGTAIDTVACPPGTVCNGEGCAGAVCTVGARRCQAGSNTVVEECSETGGAWQVREDCGGEATGKVCLAGGCEFLCRIEQQVKSSLGCDYWAVDLDNAFVPDGRGGFLDAAGAQFAVIVSNPHPQFGANVVVGRGETVVSEVQLGPGRLHVFELPRSDANGTMLGNIAYRVRSSIPVIAYQFNPLDNVDVFSNDASLLLPNTSLGTNYLIMTRQQDHSSLRGFISVVATNSGVTDVYIQVTARTEGGVGIEPLEPGGEIRRMLMPGDVLNLETADVGEDFTGSIVEASQPVAVFAGSEASNVPSRDPVTGGVACCADHLETQMFPEDTWGFRYVAARYKQRGEEEDYWRILARDDNTQIITVPHQVTVPMLDRGKFFEFGSLEDFEIYSDKPILVGQFMASSGKVKTDWQPGEPRTGDPAFTLLVPQEQWRVNYVFLVPAQYRENYINIVRPANADVTLDGVKIPNEAFTAIGQGAFYVIRLPIDEGTHYVIASEPVQIIVYGYDTDVSYAYPGGLNLEPVRP